MSCAIASSRASSLSRSGCLSDSFTISPAVLPRRATRQRARAVHVRAEQPQQPKTGLSAAIRTGCGRFLQRYDPVTTGLGSLLVAGYCMVAHQQSVGESLNIAACATVLGMVMQEVLFNDDEAKNEA